MASAGSPTDSGPQTISPRRPETASISRAAATRALSGGSCATSMGAVAAAASSRERSQPGSMSGSRSGTLTCTGPAGASRAVAAARAATVRAWASSARLPSAIGSSTDQRGWLPKRPTWSMVWFAPTSRSSGGRSAVSAISGTRDSEASTTAGSRFAAAVPEVVTTATGSPSWRARPSAKNPAARSSRCSQVRTSGSRASASVSGVEREPGVITAWRTPLWRSCAVNAPMWR